MSEILYSKKLGFANIDDAVYYLEEKWHQEGSGNAMLTSFGLSFTGNLQLLVLLKQILQLRNKEELIYVL